MPVFQMVYVCQVCHQAGQTDLVDLLKNALVTICNVSNWTLKQNMGNVYQANVIMIMIALTGVVV